MKLSPFILLLLAITSFYPPFEKIALDVVRHSPKWTPAISHNRRVRSTFRQAVVFSQPEQ